jgi:ribosome-binding factor A
VSPGRGRRYERTARVNEVAREVLADQLGRLGDPRLSSVTLTAVDVSSDLSHATVFYTVLDIDDAEAGDTVGEEAEAGLRSAAPLLRSALGRQVRWRHVPELRFRVDPGVARGRRVDQILREIHHADHEVPGEPGQHGEGP